MHENTNATDQTDGQPTPSEAAASSSITEAAAPTLSADPSVPVRFDTKVVVVLRDDLQPWQELNVTAFLMSGIATSDEGLVGENYRDADGNDYLPMLRQPVMVMTADGDKLRSIRTKAMGRGIPTAIYTEELFSTGHDAANRAAVAGVPAEELNLVGVALRGAKNGVDRVVKGARMHA
ncbi:MULTISPECIES: DUF2000 family protein [Brevibacterium]|uniref:DUF2000 family protein n=1 Tax=Brevibacterium TaxID=1696 RepID=UPI0015519597|nr:MULTISPECIES: DUF2000 family protein [Brevibacterium]MCS4594900.1 DUF2000 domain-containing protein [Brevibacterium sediminis]